MHLSSTLNNLLTPSLASLSADWRTRLFSFGDDIAQLPICWQLAQGGIDNATILIDNDTNEWIHARCTSKTM